MLRSCTFLNFWIPAFFYCLALATTQAEPPSLKQISKQNVEPTLYFIISCALYTPEIFVVRYVEFKMYHQMWLISTFSLFKLMLWSRLHYVCFYAQECPVIQRHPNAGVNKNSRTTKHATTSGWTNRMSRVTKNASTLCHAPAPVLDSTL